MAGREDYWGLGGLSGWTSEGADRLAVERAAMEWEARRLGRKGRWEKTPALWESEVGDKDDQAKDLEEALVSSRNASLLTPAPDAATDVTPDDRADVGL